MNDRDENRVLPAEILSITQGINPNTAENRLSINDNQIATATRSQLFLTDSEFNNLELRSRFEPLPVYGHVAISEGDFVYVVSGYRPIPTSSWANQPKQIYRPLRDVWRLNKITNEWYLISTFGRPEILNYGLCGAAGAIVNGALYLMYGFQKRDLSHILKLDLTTWRWEIVSPEQKSLPAPRNKHGAWSYEDNVIIFGGFGPVPNKDDCPLHAKTKYEVIEDLDDNRAWNDDLFIFDTVSKKHIPIQDIGPRPAPRAAFGSAKNGKNAYLFGGRCAPGRANDLYHFDLVHHVWTRLLTNGASPENRSWMTLTAGRDCMLLFGGLSSRKEQNSEIALSDIWIFDQNLVTSTIASDPSQRVLHFPKLWKQCGSDFSHKSWRDCPENEKKRMWHSCNYNEYNGHFIIIGGAIRQSAEEDEEILSRHNLEFQIEPPRLIDHAAHRAINTLFLANKSICHSLKEKYFNQRRNFVAHELKFLMRAFESSLEQISTFTNHHEKADSDGKLLTIRSYRDRMAFHDDLVISTNDFMTIYIRFRQLSARKYSFALQEALNNFPYLIVFENYFRKLITNGLVDDYVFRRSSRAIYNHGLI